jgi:hypothetical protein
MVFKRSSETSAALCSHKMAMSGTYVVLWSHSSRYSLPLLLGLPVHCSVLHLTVCWIFGVVTNMTIDGDEEFFAVPLTWEESDKLVHFEVELSEATKHRLQLTSKPMILACDELEHTIIGFEKFSRVFFLNFSAWLACRESGLLLRTTRKVRRADIPANYTVLVEQPSGVLQEA